MGGNSPNTKPRAAASQQMKRQASQQRHNKCKETLKHGTNKNAKASTTEEKSHKKQSRGQLQQRLNKHKHKCRRITKTKVKSKPPAAPLQMDMQTKRRKVIICYATPSSSSSSSSISSKSSSETIKDAKSIASDMQKLIKNLSELQRYYTRNAIHINNTFTKVTKPRIAQALPRPRPSPRRVWHSAQQRNKCLVEDSHSSISTNAEQRDAVSEETSTSPSSPSSPTPPPPPPPLPPPPPPPSSPRPSMPEQTKSLPQLKCVSESDAVRASKSSTSTIASVTSEAQELIQILQQHYRHNLRTNDTNISKPSAAPPTPPKSIDTPAHLQDFYKRNAVCSNATIIKLAKSICKPVTAASVAQLIQPIQSPEQLQKFYKRNAVHSSSINIKGNSKVSSTPITVPRKIGSLAQLQHYYQLNRVHDTSSITSSSTTGAVRQNKFKASQPIETLPQLQQYSKCNVMDGEGIIRSTVKTRAAAAAVANRIQNFAKRKLYFQAKKSKWKRCNNNIVKNVKPNTVAAPSQTRKQAQSQNKESKAIDGCSTTATHTNPSTATGTDQQIESLADLQECFKCSVMHANNAVLAAARASQLMLSQIRHPFICDLQAVRGSRADAKPSAGEAPLSHQMRNRTQQQRQQQPSQLQQQPSQRQQQQQRKQQPQRQQPQQQQ